MEKIDLNLFVYNETITKNDILNVISQQDIFSRYIGEPMESGYKINSPLRNDNVPSGRISHQYVTLPPSSSQM